MAQMEATYGQHNRNPIFALLIGDAISLTGSSLTSLAIPWFVLQTTGSAAKTGVAAAVTVVPVIIAGTLGGTVVDRIGLKRASVIGDAASGFAVALIPLLYVTFGLPLWLLLILAFLRTLLDEPGGAARLSLVPDVVSLADMQLDRVNSFCQTVRRATQTAGPLLAGVLIAAVGPSNVLWIDAASFWFSAAIVAIAVPDVTHSRKEGASEPGYFAGLAEGWKFIRGHHLLLTLLVVSATINLLVAPLLLVVLPVYAKRTFGSAINLGLMLAGFAVGTLAGTALYGVMANRVPRRGIYVGGILVSAAGFLLLTPVSHLFIAVTALIILGLGIGPVDPLLLTIAHERVPAELRGRFFGLMRAVAWIVMPVGLLVTGYLLQTIGLRITVTATAGLYLIFSLSLVVTPTLRQMEQVAGSID